MDAGQYYGFNKTFRDPDTSYPHKNNDLVVDGQFKTGKSDADENKEQMYKNLEPFAKNSLYELFATEWLEVEENGSVYVPEGTKCNSFGILRIKTTSSDINVETRKNRRDQRIGFKDGGENRINLSYTGDDPLKQEYFDNMQTDVLIILGFARPWKGTFNHFAIKRCTLIAVGIVYPIQ